MAQSVTMYDFWNYRYSRHHSVLQRLPSGVLRNMGFRILHNLWLNPSSASLGELLWDLCFLFYKK